MQKIKTAYDRSSFSCLMGLYILIDDTSWRAKLTAFCQM